MTLLIRVCRTVRLRRDGKDMIARAFAIDAYRVRPEKSRVYRYQGKNPVVQDRLEPIRIGPWESGRHAGEYPALFRLQMTLRSRGTDADRQRDQQENPAAHGINPAVAPWSGNRSGF